MALNKRYGQEGINGQWTCGVLLQTPTQVVMVKEDLGREPIYFKIPGGRRRPQDDTPEDTAVREVFEETGIRISPDELDYVLQQNRRNHLYHFYTVNLGEDRIKERYTVAKNCEQVHVLARDDLKNKKPEILPHHFELLESRRLGLTL